MIRLKKDGCRALACDRSDGARPLWSISSTDSAFKQHHLFLNITNFGSKENNGVPKGLVLGPVLRA